MSDEQKTDRAQAPKSETRQRITTTFASFEDTIEWLKETTRTLQRIQSDPGLVHTRYRAFSGRLILETGDIQVIQEITTNGACPFDTAF